MQVDEFLHWVVDTIGYANTVHLKDLFTFLSGAIASGLLLLLYIAKLFLRIERVSTDITFLKMELKGKVLFIANPSTFAESLETLLMAMFTRFSNRKTIHIKPNNSGYNRALLYLVITVIIIIIAIIFGVALITFQLPANYDT